MPLSETEYKKPRSRVSREKRRMNLCIDEDLVLWAFEHAGRNSTSVTQLITNFFQELRKRETERMARDAEQI